MSQPARLIKNSEKESVTATQGRDILSPELAEAVRAIVREELKADRRHRRRALLAEVDSINRELEVK